MAKKRKARDEPRRSKKTRAGADEVWNSDEGDEFTAGADTILLDQSPAAKRRRRLEEEDAALMPSDEEVFANENLSEDEEEELEDDDVSEVSEAGGADGAQEDDEEDERYWGSNRADYYGADTIEEEQDALDEEAEARRLQQKQLQSMTEADFGFDETAWAQAGQEQSKSSTIEKLPPVQIPENATDAERLQILKTRYPEFEPLSEDLLACHEEYQELKKSTKSHDGKGDKFSTQQTRLRALSAYMAAIAMYMAVLTSGKDGLSLPPSELRQHPIMNTLLRARQLWESTQDLESEDEVDVESEENKMQVDGILQPAANGISKVGAATKLAKAKSRSKGTHQEPPVPQQKKKRTESKKSQKELPDFAPTDSKPAQHAKNRTASKPTKPKRATLEDILTQSAPADVNEHDSDFGDEEPLTAEEAAAKANKKKSLRFYTSQIAQKAGKRASASRQAGGDDDLPYKERIRDREERLRREVAEQRNRGPTLEDNDVDGDDAEYDENDLAANLNRESNDYYNTLVSAGKTKKLEKQARADAHALAAAQGAQVYEDEVVGADGKRKITYAIEKNKGLQPRRKKEVRNPRVKKKKKFEEKKKKLASMRPVWKGGEALKGGYQGEKSGISTRVVKSIKL